MASNSGYTTLTHYISVDVFISMIRDAIKKLIHTYGHINCGLRHEELCEELKKFINKTKTPILSLMDTEGKKEWNTKWGKKRNEFFNRLFEEEGFINMCYPKNFKTNPSLYQLKSKHIQFCKERDVRRAAVVANPLYSKCVNYNSWINKETTKLIHEFLENVKISKFPTVKKYFSTKTQPEGYDPRDIYPKSKLDCNQYNPPTRSLPQEPVEKVPQSSIHLPTSPEVGQESQGKGEKSMPDRGVGIQKKQSDAMIPPQTEPPASDTQTSSPSNAKVDDTDNGQNGDLKAKGTDLSSKDQGAVSDSSPSTTSATSHTTYSTQKVSSPSGPDVSLPQSQTPTVAAVPSQHQIPVTVQNSNESTPPDSIRKSTDQGASVTSSLGSGLAPSHVATSNSSASETSSTSTISTTRSSPDQGSHLPTPSTQPSVTTPIDKTLTETTISLSGPPTITGSAVSTNPIPSIIVIKSTTGESGEPNVLPKSIANSQDLNSASPKKQDDALSPNSASGTNFSDTSSSPTIANSNINLHPDPSYDPPYLHLSIPYPGLPSGVSPVGFSPVLSVTPTVVSKQEDSADDNKIITLPKETSEQSKDSTQVTSTSLPEGTQPIGKPSVTPTKFPPLTNIIPTVVIILATITLLFLLYKYTPFGLLLGRRRKRKKRDLRSTFVIPEKPTYEYPNITVLESEDPNLVRQTKENDVYIKLLKINRYKQKIQKRKKENKKTLIEVHMEVLEEYKSDEWELHKGDFLEICLRGFINEENDDYSKLPNTELTEKSTKNDKIIEDIQKKEILWNNWIENHRNILEQWKKKEWFHILKNKWKKEQQIYKEKNNKLQKNISNEQDTHSIVSKKETWKQWILKQATLIDMFNKEDWFKSIIYAQDKEKDNNRTNEYNNISVTSKTELKNEKTNEEGRSKNIIQKLMVQIHMMVLEECIKEDIIRNKESSIDNFMQDIHKQNSYDEERNMPQCDTDNFKVPEFEEIHTSKNK